jgi:predicted Fe-Mo cluster-binding NifX family protein
MCPGREEIMNICIPVSEDKGLESPVSAHFGSAPLFLIVDTESGNCKAVSNGNLNHGHGLCQPLRSIAGESINSIVVGGIGAGALAKLQDADITVYLSELPTVHDALEAFKAGTLRLATIQSACAHHDRGQQGRHGVSQRNCHSPNRLRS